MSGTLVEVLSQPLWQRVTLTLMHFLWQGIVVALLLSVAIDLFRIRSAPARYVLSLGALSLLAACPLLLSAPGATGFIYLGESRRGRVWQPSTRRSTSGCP